MYWRWQSLPELADLPADRRKEIWRDARRDPFRPADFGWLVLILLAWVRPIFALIFLPKSLSIWIGMPAFLALALAMGRVMDAILICRYRPVVRRLVAASQPRH